MTMSILLCDIYNYISRGVITRCQESVTRAYLVDFNFALGQRESAVNTIYAGLSIRLGGLAGCG